MEREYQICKRCVMDTTDPDIVFDENGFCNHCTNAIKRLNEIYFIDPLEKKKKLEKIVEKIKSEGKNKKYDCVIGLSGGVDSSYLAYIVVKELGLRPLAIHVDNGWNSELAVMNIENIVNKLGIDLITYVIDWEEFKELQKAYLKSSVIDLEVLSDNAIVVAIYRIMKRYKQKYFLIGFNLAAESIMPSSWLYSPKYDSLNILSIYKKFGNSLKLKTYPLFNLWEYIYYRFLDNSTSVNILDLVEYNKKSAVETLEKELDWRQYGAKHHESKITEYYQAYILPTKFNVDKRKAHLSSLICSKQITRNEALKELSKPLYDKEKFFIDKEYFLKKLDFDEEEFNDIMNNPPILHYNYPSWNKIIQFLGYFKSKVIRFYV
ncbi:MAG: N-acetyl sugar amidotransferase [Candidatus Woesearchaeota archaeon]